MNVFGREIKNQGLELRFVVIVVVVAAAAASVVVAAVAAAANVDDVAIQTIIPGVP